MPTYKYLDKDGLEHFWGKVDERKQDKLVAGTNIQIAADGKTISATDTTYTAGNGIDITNDEISIDASVVATKSDLPTKTSDLTNDGSDGTSTYVEADDLATVATTGSYTDLLNKPTIGDATIKIQKNSVDVDSFTTNAITNKTIDIAVPTKTSELTNDGSDGVSPFVDATSLASDLALKQDKLTAGANITIDANNEISATDTTYSAGNGLNLNGTTFSADTTVLATQTDLTNLGNTKQDKLTQTQLNAVDSGIDATKVAQIATNTGNITSVTNRVSTIEGKIPSAATSSNKLTDKDYVDNAVATNSANYISDNGQPFTSLADLEAYSGPLTNNDYAFVVSTDAQGNTIYTHYKYSASTQTWAEEYSISNPTFSSTQWAAIDSGVTANDVAQIGTNKTDIASLQSGKQDKLTTAQQDAVDSGIDATKVTQITTNANNITNLQNNKQDKLSQAQLDAVNSGITSAKVTKLDGIESGAEVNVQADWTEANSSSDAYIKNKPTLATVATSGSYNDLVNKPTIGNATLTVQKNSTTIDTFTANATTDKIINIPVPTKTSDITNDGSDGTSTYVEADDLATVATSGSYNDLTNKPTIGNATLTIQKNSSTIDTFTANATSNKTINIPVPTKTSDITNDGSDGTSTYVEADDLATALAGKADKSDTYTKAEVNAGTDNLSVPSGMYTDTSATASVTGSDATLQNTVGSLAEATPYGDTYQFTTTGKNLIKFDDIPLQSNQTINYYRQHAPQINTTLVAGKTYTLTADVTIGGSVSSAYFTIGAGATSYNADIVNTSSATNVQSGHISITFTPTQTQLSYGTNVYFRFPRFNTATTTGVDYSISNLMLEESASGSPYEPYTAGASPNPAYPQKINVVTGEQTLNITGQNLLSTWRVLGEPSDTSFGNTTKRLFAPDTYVYGLSANNYYASNNISDFTENNGTYTFQSSTSGYGLGLPLKLKAGETYSVSGVISPAPSTAFRLAYYAADGTPLGYTNKAGNGDFTVPSDCDMVVLCLVPTANTLTTWSNLQIEHAASPSTYEAYKGNSFTLNLGKNLFDNSTLYHGYYLASDIESLTADEKYRTVTIDNLPAGTYTFSTDLTDCVILRWWGDGVNNTVTAQRQTQTFTTTTTGKFGICFRNSSTSTITQNILCQVEAGYKATSYAEYFAPIELAKIDSYQDYIFHNVPSNEHYNASLVNGAWYVHKNNGKTILRGNESWSEYSNDKSCFHAYISPAPIILTDEYTLVNIVSDYYIATYPKAAIDQTVSYGISLNDGTAQFRVQNKDCADAPAFKAWLAAHHTIVYYPIATPTDTIITNAELISQLNAVEGMETFSPDTFISVSAVSPNLPFIGKFSGYKDNWAGIQEAVSDKQDKF